MVTSKPQWMIVVVSALAWAGCDGEPAGGGVEQPAAPQVQPPAAPVAEVEPAPVEEQRVAPGPPRAELPADRRWLPAWTDDLTCHYAWDSVGNSAIEELRFDAEHRLVEIDAIDNPAAHITTETRRFDRRGRIESARVVIHDSAGGPGRQRLRYVYEENPAARTVRVSITGGYEPAVESYTYDAQGRPVLIERTEEGSSATTRCDYGRGEWPTRMERGGIVTEYDYDAEGRLLGWRGRNGEAQWRRDVERTGERAVTVIEIDPDGEWSGTVVYTGSCVEVLFAPCARAFAPPPPR